MSKIKFYRDTEVNVPTGAGHAGKVYFTNERNLYVIDSAGNKIKISDVIFTANEADLAGLSTKYRNKIYVAEAEGTMWRWTGSALAALGSAGGGSGDVVGPAGAVNDRIATFSGTTGKLLRDGGNTIAQLLSRSSHSGSQDASTITGTKTASFISDFAATVRATVLTGYAIGSNAALAATDTILAAFGKLQAQINHAISLASSALPSSAVIDEDDMVSDDDTRVPTQQSVKAYVDTTLTAIGAGDMDKATYDSDNSGTVDNAEALEGQQGAHYLNRANHTGTQAATTIIGTKTASFISDFAATVLANVLAGLSTATATAVTAADSVLVAFGKLQAQINGKQATLVSATNIKTINSASILGSGDLVVSAGAAGATGDVQFNNAGALASDSLFDWDNTNKRLGVGIAAPLHRLHVKGAGATAATFSLVAENSAGSQMIAIKDDGQITIGQTSKANLNITNNYAASLNFTTTNFSNWNGTVYAQFSGLQPSDSTFIFGAAGGIHLSAKLQIDSTTKGFLPPRMTGTQVEAIASPAAGLMVFATIAGAGAITAKGWWGFDGSNWLQL